MKREKKVRHEEMQAWVCGCASRPRCLCDRQVIRVSFGTETIEFVRAAVVENCTKTPCCRENEINFYLYTLYTMLSHHVLKHIAIAKLMISRFGRLYNDMDGYKKKKNLKTTHIKCEHLWLNKHISFIYIVSHSAVNKFIAWRKRRK